MESEETKPVAKGAFSFFSGTLISRFSGLGRDLSMAFYFGSHPAIAAFMVAYRFSNLFRRMIGEGAVSSGFIPHFEILRKESKEEGVLFFRDVFFSLLVFLVALVLVLSSGLWIWIHYGNPSADVQEILSLTLFMIPGLVFICLYAISSALLQCERKFFLPSIAPVLFNLVWIAMVFFFRNSIPSKAALSLSWAVVLGFFLQWALLVPSMKSYIVGSLGWNQVLKFRLFPKEVKSLLKPFALALFGVSATQVNSFMDAIFARYASLEGPAYLWYAIRIQQLPLALFGVALSTALLPALSRAVSNQNWGEFQRLLRFSLSRSFSFMFPCTIGLFVLGVCGVNLLYGRGDFGGEATRETVLCLWGYGIGLVPYVFVLLMSSAFYAQKNYRAPMRAAFFSVILNGILNAVFIFGLNWGAMSVAISTSLSAWYNFFYLSKALKQERLFEPGLYKGALCSCIAGGVALLMGYYLLGDKTISVFLGEKTIYFSRKFIEQVLHFFALSGVFSLMFISYAWLLDIKEVFSILRIPRRERL